MSAAALATAEREQSHKHYCHNALAATECGVWAHHLSIAATLLWQLRNVGWWSLKHSMFNLIFLIHII